MKIYHIGDLIHLQNSYNSGMFLVSASLIGKTYSNPQSRSVRIALGAKSKLELINSLCLKPSDASDDIEQWRRVDYMVKSWILNSTSKEIVEASLYTSSSNQLQEEIIERFEKANGTLICQLRREISSISQESQSAEYFTTFKKLQDELMYFMHLSKLDYECQATNDLVNMIFSIS